ncbi:uncharacterized protein LOC113762321 [Coffea eugenioides]|uniref:uncharacterized protein LOC113762321 n=1 Tax=Coffea eugenioides TaxID=49369 RepID=UPI000F61371C|nr:uncharacterized protein LOC113762321 [Coffea eugenioides]
MPSRRTNLRPEEEEVEKEEDDRPRGFGFIFCMAAVGFAYILIPAIFFGKHMENTLSKFVHSEPIQHDDKIAFVVFVGLVLISVVMGVFYFFLAVFHSISLFIFYREKNIRPILDEGQSLVQVNEGIDLIPKVVYKDGE